MSTAREHAIIASELLDKEDQIEAELRKKTPLELLELAATGAIRDLNRDREYSISLAQAHALTAIGLTLGDATASLALTDDGGPR
jgi:hypothetical protein